MSAGFIARHGLWTAEQQDAAASVEHALAGETVQRVRLSFADLHGVLRGKVLMPEAARATLRDGLRMVGTLLLKDTSHRTVYPVFEAAGERPDAAFSGAGDVVMVPDPSTWRMLPWSPGTAWMQCQAYFPDGRPVPLDPRWQLRRALQRLAERGMMLRTGLEVEFHIYRLEQAALDPQQAAWPGDAPQVSMVHPGFNVLTEQWFDRAEEPLRLVERTAHDLGLPLTSLEIELGPSQVEAVFAPADGLVNADRMVLFRSAVKQVLWRHGYHASFMCRPPFPQIMSSGWHLHQSLADERTGDNLFTPRAQDLPAGLDAHDARNLLSPLGAAYLGGLLAHARSHAVFAVPTLNGYGRYQPNALAPQQVLWGRDNRGAMLRVMSQGVGDGAARIENRAGEPLANPYLYMASQIHAGLDGIDENRDPGAQADSPYAGDGPRLPTTLDEALECLEADTGVRQAFGPELVAHLLRVKRAELARAAQAASRTEWERREYFSLY